MNLLEKEVLKLIGEDTTTPDVFIDDATGLAQIRDSINHGIWMITMGTGGYQKRFFLPLRADLQFYRISWESEYFGYVIQAWDRERHQRLEQTDVVKLSHQDPAWMQTTGYVEAYFHVGYQFLGIYRKPSSDNCMLELDCACIPKAYSADTDAIKLRQNFERAVIQYAVSEYHASRGDANRATEWINRAIETAGLKKLNPQQAERQYQFGGYKRFNEARK